ncbi:MAG: ATP-dependent Clp protease adaptor ClpS [Treponema sp.]|nr:ATP-dependent Clp protease adaptor ClpS [Treponema sp.]MBO4639203.1 ATP-dependent Clp protease adaptor ClpS [Treponema sp.]
MSEFINQPLHVGSGVAETTSIEVPPEKDVVFYNDDYTTMEFVVEVLVSIFNKSHDDAEQLMTTVHNSGSAVVGTYTYDIAVSRTNLTRSIAKKNGFPLRVEVE